ncbi:MAG: C39 family peptidase [Chloroflexota bacterium]
MKKLIFPILIAILFVSVATVAQVMADDGNGSEYFSVETITLDNGSQAEAITINGPPEPPPGFERGTLEALPESNGETIKTLSVPAFNWSFGCSATSAAMIAGYYDNNGYSNMYAGPTNGGVMPMDNSSWPDWYDGTAWRHQCPLSATHNGLDGRTTRGHVDDFWISYGNTSNDPYITNGWGRHTYGDCTGDYMKTNQSAYGNSDGSTTFYSWPSGAPMTSSDLVSNGWANYDGGYGLKLFYESRGYTVNSMFNQRIKGVGTDPNQGFTFADYKTEIDAGRPVMIHVTGHTMVGVGYDDSSNTVYLNDTWDYSTHTMTWGGSYSGMNHFGVTIVRLAPLATSLVSPSGSIGANYNPTYTWNKVNNVTWYYLWVNGPSGNVIKQWYDSSVCGASTCSVTPSTPLGGGSHTWWVQTYNSAGYGPWSSSMTFSTTVPTPPGAATLSSPSGYIGESYTPTYTWSKVIETGGQTESAATYYYLWVQGASGPVIKQWYASSVCGASTCSVTPSTALGGGNYTWWVQTWNSAGYGPWSSGLTFSTATPSAPGQTTLSSPSGSITDTTPTYTWSKVNAATYYYLWVNGPSGNVIKQWYTASSICGVSTCSVTPGTALSGGDYTWWVQTWNPVGYGPWSSGLSFNLPVTGFNSQFNGSSTGWQTHSGSWWIDSSQWYVTTGLYQYWSSTSYNSTFSNFDYQVRLGRIGSSGSNCADVRGTPTPLGSDYDWYSGYSFCYGNDGYYSVWKSTSGSSWSSLQSWTYSSTINTGGGWNTLRVVANGSSLYLYINGTLVWSGSDASLSSGRVGVEMYDSWSSGEKLWIDWATLSTIEGTVEITDTISPEQQALNEAANVQEDKYDKAYRPLE